MFRLFWRAAEVEKRKQSSPGRGKEASSDTTTLNNVEPILKFSFRKGIVYRAGEINQNELLSLQKVTA